MSCSSSTSTTSNTLIARRSRDDSPSLAGVGSLRMQEVDLEWALDAYDGRTAIALVILVEAEQLLYLVVYVL